MSEDDFDKSSDFNKGGTPSLPSVTESTTRYLEHHRKKYATQVRQLEQCIAAAISRGEPEVTINCEFHSNSNENEFQRFISEYLSWLGYPVSWTDHPKPVWRAMVRRPQWSHAREQDGRCPDNPQWSRGMSVDEWELLRDEKIPFIHTGEETSVLHFVTGIIVWGPGVNLEPPRGKKHDRIRKVWLMNPDNHHRRNEP